jgi:uncharacterized membrane protein
MIDDGPKGSFVRWQSITIGQFTYAIDLVLGLSVAALGFQVALLLNSEFKPAGCFQKSAFLFSLILIFVSVSLGLFAIINRLCDFRMTAKVARMREKGVTEAKMAPYRFLYKKLGKRTWHLFWWQIGTFGVGVCLVVLSIATTFAYKLI